MCPSRPYDESQPAYPCSLSAFADPQKYPTDPEKLARKPFRRASGEPQSNPIFLSQFTSYCSSCLDKGSQRGSKQKFPDLSRRPATSRLKEIRHNPLYRSAVPPQDDNPSFIVAWRRNVNDLPRKPRGTAEYYCRHSHLGRDTRARCPCHAQISDFAVLRHESRVLGGARRDGWQFTCQCNKPTSDREGRCVPSETAGEASVSSSSGFSANRLIRGDAATTVVSP